MNAMLLVFGMPGPTEMLIVLFICLLLFGGSRLPSLMRNLGASAREFQKGVRDGTDDDDAGKLE
ncbi:MAG: twin-arginine translocase TatA/TatE family subunit [Planctomycetales bacterium]|nr:twin-arginine translocase TatA/TatE family subunit [Planctomycetales bacterium]